MKKILSLGAVLLTAVLLFSGCSNAAGGGDETLPGRWSNTANYWDDKDVYYDAFYRTDDQGNKIVKSGTIKRDGKGGAVYENNNPLETGAPGNELQDGWFRNNLWKFMKDTDITGFEATAKCTSKNSSYGFAFNIQDWNNYYELIFLGQKALIRKKINGIRVDFSDLATNGGWISNSRINVEPGENKVTVYKDGDSIIIKVNGATIYTIQNPELKMGIVAFACGISYADIQNHTHIKTTYQITNLQR